MNFHARAKPKVCVVSHGTIMCTSGSIFPLGRIRASTDILDNRHIHLFDVINLGRRNGVEVETRSKKG